jgi:preprotein translocase subunit SecB
MSQVSKAAFSLEDIYFQNFSFACSSENRAPKVVLDFWPTGKFSSGQSLFELTLDFNAFDKNDKGGMQAKPIVSCKFIALFKFIEINQLEDIPSYFYKNSTAIVYPFLRSFVSTLTLQAGWNIMMLPLLNLSILEDDLKRNTINVESIVSGTT